MKALPIEEINTISPYKVEYGGNDDYVFITDNEIIYNISFMEDMQIAGCQTYQFSIRRLTDISKGHDLKVKSTIIAILESFFSVNHDVLIYICDDSDGREAMRNRLFAKWFKDYDENNRFTVKTANAIVEGKGFYTAIIVENSHPKLRDIIWEFKEVAKALTSK